MTHERNSPSLFPLAPSKQELEAVPVSGEAPSESLWSSVAFTWRRKWLIAFFLLIGLGGGYLYFLREVPLYRSNARLLVVSQQRSPLSDGQHGGIHETAYDRTRIELLTSPVVIERAVQQGSLSDLPTFRGASNPTARILANLKVVGNETPNNISSDVLTLSFTSPYGQDCPKVLNALTEAFGEFMSETYKSINDETVKLILEAKEDLNNRLKDLGAQHRELRENAPLLWQGEDSHNVHEERLTQIEAARSAAVLENSQLNARIQAIDAALANSDRLDALRFLIEQDKLRIGTLPTALSGATATGALPTGALPTGALPTGALSTGTLPSSQPVATVSPILQDDSLLPMLIEEQQLLQKYGPEYPKVIAIRKEIELRRKHLSGLAAAGATNPLDLIAAYRESLAERVRINDVTIAEMTDLFERERADAKQLVEHQLKDRELRAEMERISQLFAVVVKRLEEMSIAKDADRISTSLIHPPGIGMQVSPNLARSLSIAGALGLLVGLALAYGLESSDRRFRSPDEIRAVLGVPVVGHTLVSHSEEAPEAAVEDSAASRVDRTLCALHAPRGRAAEAYRGVRTALYFSTRGRGHQVIQVTSPTPGDGKTTLATNLAVSIAQSGKRVLLIDADFRRPRVHSIFGTEPQFGMSSVIAGTSELSDAVQAGPVDNLFILPCGPRPNNPAELLTSRRFEELLEILREKYEFVIIDTPPVLAVTDPLAVAPRVDGVLLVLRLTKTARGRAQRALGELNNMNANMLGVIVNGVGTPLGHGYAYGEGAADYEHYGYGGYAYGYGADDDGYYADAVTKPLRNSQNGDKRPTVTSVGGRS